MAPVDKTPKMQITVLELMKCNVAATSSTLELETKQLTLKYFNVCVLNRFNRKIYFIT